ncbi:hypothetical protein BDF19DRAFT_465732 [Syncephalis fuscata]|nr:hypothetical protein BDF19DRAFT_465732 [Syncephalis fuscata]
MAIHHYSTVILAITLAGLSYVIKVANGAAHIMAIPSETAITTFIPAKINLACAIRHNPDFAMPRWQWSVTMIPPASCLQCTEGHWLMDNQCALIPPTRYRLNRRQYSSYDPTMEMPDTTPDNDATSMAATTEQPILIHCNGELSTQMCQPTVDITSGDDDGNDDGDEDNNNNNNNGTDMTKNTFPTKPNMPAVIKSKPNNEYPQPDISQSVIIAPKSQSTACASTTGCPSTELAVNMPVQQIQQIQNIQMAASGLSGTAPSLTTDTLPDISVQSPKPAVNSQCSKGEPVGIAASTTVCGQ